MHIDIPHALPSATEDPSHYARFRDSLALVLGSLRAHRCRQPCLLIQKMKVGVANMPAPRVGVQQNESGGRRWSANRPRGGDREGGQ
jgi:hypothetical protein